MSTERVFVVRKWINAAWWRYSCLCRVVKVQSAPVWMIVAGKKGRKLNSVDGQNWPWSRRRWAASPCVLLINIEKWLARSNRLGPACPVWGVGSKWMNKWERDERERRSEWEMRGHWGWFLAHLLLEIFHTWHLSWGGHGRCFKVALWNSQESWECLRLSHRTQLGKSFNLLWMTGELQDSVFTTLEFCELRTNSVCQLISEGKLMRVQKRSSRSPYGVTSSFAYSWAGVLVSVMKWVKWRFSEGIKRIESYLELLSSESLSLLVYY